MAKIRLQTRYTLLCYIIQFTTGFLLVNSEKHKGQDIDCKQIIIYVIIHDSSLRALCPVFRTVTDLCLHCSLMISTGMGGSLGRFAYSDRITRYL